MIASPGLSQSRYELDENLVQAFQNGFAAAAAEDTPDDYNLLFAVWEHVYGQGKDARSYFTEKRSSSSFIELDNDIRLEDQPIQKIKKAERDYFRVNTFQEAIARRLTLVSRWGCQYTPPHQQHLRKAGEFFVTDYKLWKWIMLF
ncbi:hypothetical protein AnigIFM63604_000182 [Aspergillus niger]|nr:hypothetical protein AlacWU_06553 [Aspergillus niger]GLA44893.1 hypothetical protein AnigIFM63604_000182 [Aspergillus niger]